MTTDSVANDRELVPIESGPIHATAAVFGWTNSDDTDDPVAVMDGIASRTAFVQTCLNRHLDGDWGDDVDEHDVLANNADAREGLGRVLSSFRVPDDLIDNDGQARLWITTSMSETERYTTVLWPSDY